MSSSAQPANGSYTDLSEYCSSHPDALECANNQGYYQYPISLPANATFLALFSLSLLLYLGTYAFVRRGLGFTIAMVLGCTCEVLGYAGRIMGWKNRFDMNGFLIQICCLTIGPAFMAAGIYLCLRRIVYAFGREGSRIRPEFYTRIFIPCDVVSLVLQAAGGGMASVASQNDDFDGIARGDNIMIAGLSFQVFTLFCFMAFSADFAYRTYRRTKCMGSSAALDQDPDMQKQRRSPMFRGFLVALALATVCIFVRSIFRVAELSKGWTGPIMGNQGMFIGFEGVLIVVATLVMNFFHPALCFRIMLEGQGGIGFGKNKNRGTRKADEVVLEGEGDGRSGSEGGEKGSSKVVAV